MSKRRMGRLIIIGGHEDRDPRGKLTILRAVCRRAKEGAGRLALVTVATSEPEEMAAQYEPVFKDLGVRRVDVVDVRTRDQAHDESLLEAVRAADVLFLTGGDQLRITSQIGDSPLFRCLQERHAEGATIAGTSAGAACMPETMLISGPGDTSYEISALKMAPGLGLISGVVIDSHFAERGRLGRLLGAVAQNPRNLGLGIDEDTAIAVEPDGCFTVLGAGAVYVADGAPISYSSLSESHPEGVVSIFEVRLHVLAEGDTFDLRERSPRQAASAAGS